MKYFWKVQNFARTRSKGTFDADLVPIKFLGCVDQSLYRLLDNNQVAELLCFKFEGSTLYSLWSKLNSGTQPKIRNHQMIPFEADVRTSFVKHTQNAAFKSTSYRDVVHLIRCLWPVS